MNPDPYPYEYLLDDDLVTPLHHHDNRHDCLVMDGPDGLRQVSASQASAYVGRHRGIRSIAEVDHVADGPRRVTRRAVLAGASAGLGALLATSFAPRYAFGAANESRDLLVVIFLRGGMDGLSAVAPLDDKALLAARPSIGLRGTDLMALDDRFGLNRNLGALKPLYDAGQLAVVVGAGHPQVSRSHFEDMALVERAAPATMRTGWIGRHLETSSSSAGTLRAVTRGARVTLSMMTSNQGGIAMGSLGDFDLQGMTQSRSSGALQRSIAGMYAEAGGEAASRAAQTVGAVGAIASVRAAGVSQGSYPAATDQYGAAFVAGLRDIAAVARAGKGLEAACLDFNDWDMHRDVGRASHPDEWFARKSIVLAGALAAFREQVGDQWSRTTVITVSEFGRRVEENAGWGLDHGHGNVMFVAGGGIKGGKVYGSLPSLAPANLVMGDVPVTVDYRQVLSEIVTKRLGNGANLPAVFPGFTPGKPLGIA